jgi:NADH:ubiquinone oxidoreductase subunit 3 (subunit A)
VEGPGAKFWFKMAGGIVLGGIVLFIFLALFVKAIVAWGFLAALIVLAVLLCGFGWVVDRRNAGARS